MRWLKIGGCVALAGLLGGLLLITGRMVRLDAGLRENLEATQRLIDVQRAVRDKNEVLAEMVVVTERLEVGLAGLSERSGAIGEQVVAVSAANRETLAFNEALAAAGVRTNDQLQAMAQALASLGETAGYIQGYMQEMQAVLRDDVAMMRQVMENTGAMNSRLPDWLLR